MKSSVLVLTIILFLPLLLGCRNELITQRTENYPRMVGDIAPDANLDDAEFTICNGDERIIQYFNTMQGFRYQGEKSALVSEILELYSPVENPENESGYIRIRFVVNCKGQTGRFRVLSSDLKYQEKEFKATIVDQLVDIVKNLKGWKVLSKEGKTLDYYQYLIFKINEGRIIEILP